MIKSKYGEKLGRHAMFLSNLDEVDRRIIELLLQNARISYSDIGNKVGLSRVAVRARITALEKRGIIESYTAVINPQKLEDTVSCYFEIETCPNTFQQVCSLLAAHELVTQIYQVTGSCRLLVHVVAAGHDELEQFLTDTIHTLPGLETLRCNIILSRLKDVKGLRL